MTKNRIKQPKETALTTEVNSSNLERTNQYWYNPVKLKNRAQKAYTTSKGTANEVGVVFGIHPDSILIR